MLARSKLNSIESKISEALINNEISHEDFMTIINEEIKCRELKNALKWWIVKEMMLKKINLIEEGKKAGIKEVIKHKKIIINNLKP